jgi:hypothetical protein
MAEAHIFVIALTRAKKKGFAKLKLLVDNTYGDKTLSIIQTIVSSKLLKMKT